MNKVLAIVAHPDDEIIGVGGTLRKHVKAGDQVAVLIMGDGKSSRQDYYEPVSEITKSDSFAETEVALNVLGIKQSLRLELPDNRFDGLDFLDVVKKVSTAVAEFKPNIVYTHHASDLNIDHRIAFQAALTACRPIENKVEQLLSFETLSSTEMSAFSIERPFLPNVFVNIESELEDKLQAMKAYNSELREFPHPRSLETIKLNAKLWGSKNNVGACEAFVMIREIRD